METSNTEAVQKVETRIRIRGNDLTIELDPRTLELNLLSESDEASINIHCADLAVIVRVVRALRRQAKEIAELTEYA